VAPRYENWKVVSAVQRATGTLLVWANPFTKLRVTKFFDLRADPCEHADLTSNTYWDWLIDHVYIGSGGPGCEIPDDVQGLPPSQRAASFPIDQVMEKLQQPAGD
jgi:hypothetical protein